VKQSVVDYLLWALLAIIVGGLFVALLYLTVYP
jgi:hypothetical protein